MVLNYDELRRIHRLEKNSSRLTELEEDFFDELNEFVDEEKKAYFDSLKDFSIPKTRSFTNLKKLVEEIFLIREKKILNKVLVAAKTKEKEFVGFTPEEKKLFSGILKQVESHDALLDMVFSAEKRPSGKKKPKTLNKVRVRISSEIPSFVGTDMKEYGPFKKGEETELPASIAKLLEGRNLVKLK
jgi:DNA replication factor GINS